MFVLTGEMHGAAIVLPRSSLVLFLLTISSNCVFADSRAKHRINRNMSIIVPASFQDGQDFQSQPVLRKLQNLPLEPESNNSDIRLVTVTSSGDSESISNGRAQYHTENGSQAHEQSIFPEPATLMLKSATSAKQVLKSRSTTRFMICILLLILVAGCLAVAYYQISYKPSHQRAPTEVLSPVHLAQRLQHDRAEAIQTGPVESY